MNIQQAVALISNKSFSVEELDNQINSSHLIKEVQKEALRISKNPDETRSISQIEKACRIGKRAETILLNLKDPQTGENLFKDNPEKFHDLIFIPTGEKVEVKSRRSLSAAINYIDKTLSSITSYNKAEWCVFFIGTDTSISFYKLIELGEKPKQEVSTFNVKKKGSTYTIKTETFFRLLRTNSNILFEDFGITKSAKWFDLHKRISQYENGGYYIFENMLK